MFSAYYIFLSTIDITIKLNMPQKIKHPSKAAFILSHTNSSYFKPSGLTAM